MEKSALPEGMTERNEEVQSQKQMEEVFWEFFGDKVLEWNPCFSEEGAPRFFWDEEIEAHDMEVDREALEEGFWKTMKGTWVDAKCPERVRLRSVLDVMSMRRAEARSWTWSQ